MSTELERREARYLEQRREELTLQGIMEGKSPTQAAIDAGFGPSVTRRPRKFLEGRGLRRRVQREMDGAGATIAEMAGAVAGALQANKDDTADHKTRLGAARLVADLYGVTERAAAGATTQVVINIPSNLAGDFAFIDGERKG